MFTIWKFPLEMVDIQVVQMPHNSEILCAQMQNDKVCVWARVDNAETQPSHKVMFYVHGTGHAATSPTSKYLGTVQMHDGALVYHVFWENARGEEGHE